MFPFGETVTRLRGVATEDPYSGETTDVDWANPSELPIAGVGFDPGGSAEPVQVDSDQRVITQPTIYDPSYADVLAGDRIRRELTGKTYEVDGDPAEWRSPFTGWQPGQVIRLKIVEG